MVENGSVRIGVRSLRGIVGWVVALVMPGLVTVGLIPIRDASGPSFEALSLLAITVACALIGGLWPAVSCAVVSTLLLNYFFAPPLYTLAIANPANLVTLVVFLAVGVGVSSVVVRAERSRVAAQQARREADMLGELNRILLASDQQVETILTIVCDAFGMDGAALLRPDGPGRWERLAGVGAAPDGPAYGHVRAPVAEDLVLVLHGRALDDAETRALTLFAGHVALARDREAMLASVQAARDLAEGDRLRTAILGAVSHDLRTPLAGITAAVTSLQSPDITWSEQDRARLLGAIATSAGRLEHLIGNLLEMSRLHVGGVRLDLVDTGLEDVVWRAIESVADPDAVEVSLPVDLPEVRVDIGLLERVIANLVQNAVRHSPIGVPASLTAVHAPPWVEVRVVDHGPGVPDEKKDLIFRPFQRLGDKRPGASVGLGLAVARGLTRAQGGTLGIEDTPFGGLTLVIGLPEASRR